MTYQQITCSQCERLYSVHRPASLKRSKHPKPSHEQRRFTIVIRHRIAIRGHRTKPVDNSIGILVVHVKTQSKSHVA